MSPSPPLRGQWGASSYLTAAVTAFWRAVLGINLLYELALVFLLFQDLDSARSMMKYIDPNLGRPLPEKSYAENCDLTVENVWVRLVSCRRHRPRILH